MLTIKPTTSPSKDPDPARALYDTTQVLFIQDEPQPIIPPDEPKQQDFQMAKREQGGSIALQHSQMNPKDAQQDIPTPALSDDYKKAIQNQTYIKDQDDEGGVNILEDVMIDQEEQLEKQILSTQEDRAQMIEEQTTFEHTSPIELPQDFQTKTKQLTLGERLQTIIQEKMQKTTESSSDKPTHLEKEESLQPNLQKVVSKKHRPADLGQENLSKVQLSKPAQDTPTQKKKLSLQDIQSGFSQFIRNGNTVQQTSIPTASALGNSLFFSTDGNSDKDDIAGLKKASYMHQIGQMYHNAGHEFIDAISNIVNREGLPGKNNYVTLTIERSGKISAITAQSCGNQAIDHYHLKAIDAIGTFPPIPKYIDAPMHVTAQIPFEKMKFTPGARLYRSR
ncbi:TonB C-terminal domain-containing protein [Candidatus Babeliales bacterium]|nr:TonB C-terminal domain-containing protein [Candidatus Babeliales bacterium]